MTPAFDDFDLYGIEEQYSPRRYEQVICDFCEQRTLATRVHFMQTFESDKEFLMCDRCYKKLKEGCLFDEN